MTNTLFNAVKDLIAFYKSAKPLHYLYLILLHIFVGWNGVQFILNPTHLVLFVDYHSLNENYYAIVNTQPTFSPLFIYICVTFLLLYLLIKIYCEVSFRQIALVGANNLSPLQQDTAMANNLSPIPYTSVKTNFNLLINFLVPAFFHNLGAIIVLSSIYLLFLIIYIILVILNIHIPIDAYDLIRLSITYFTLGIVCFNAVLIDFVLPDMPRSLSFSESLKKFYLYFEEHKLNICFFYALKFCLMGICTLIYIYGLLFILREPIYDLPLSVDLYSSLFCTLKILSSILLSMCLYAIFLQFFNIYCFLVMKRLFNDYYYDIHNSQIIIHNS